MISARLRPRTGLPRAEALLRGGADVALMLQWCILWEQHGVFDSASVAVNCWVLYWNCCVFVWDLETIILHAPLICKYKVFDTLLGDFKHV